MFDTRANNNLTSYSTASRQGRGIRWLPVIVLVIASESSADRETLGLSTEHGSSSQTLQKVSWSLWPFSSSSEASTAVSPQNAAHVDGKSKKKDLIDESLIQEIIKAKKANATDPKKDVDTIAVRNNIGNLRNMYADLDAEGKQVRKEAIALHDEILELVKQRQGLAKSLLAQREVVKNLSSKYAVVEGKREKIDTSYDFIKRVYQEAIDMCEGVSSCVDRKCQEASNELWQGDDGDEQVSIAEDGGTEDFVDEDEESARSVRHRQPRPVVRTAEDSPTGSDESEDTESTTELKWETSNATTTSEETDAADSSKSSNDTFMDAMNSRDEEEPGKPEDFAKACEENKDISLYLLQVDWQNDGAAFQAKWKDVIDRTTLSSEQKDQIIKALDELPDSFVQFEKKADKISVEWWQVPDDEDEKVGDANVECKDVR